MLLQDNFVHTDLHPGNILVRAANNGRGDGPASSGNEPSGGDSDGGASDGASSGGGNGDLPSQQQRQKIELILIDFGLCQVRPPNTGQGKTKGMPGSKASTTCAARVCCIALLPYR